MAEQNIPDGFDYQGDVYRPPGEADSILIQATVGCSHNTCTFCSGYRGKPFAIKGQEILEQDLRFAEQYCKRQDRVFIIDGNALVMPMPRWQWLLANIQRRLPWITGVGCFATAMDIAAKSDKELQQLRTLGLDRVYMGVESGLADVLVRIRKGITPQGLLDQGRRAKAAGMELQVSLIIGIVNEMQSFEHARATGTLLSAMDPDVVTVLTLVPQPGTPMREELNKRELVPPDQLGVLRELRELLRHTNLNGGLFDCGHSTGYLSFKVCLPDQKQNGLDYIDAALAKRIPLRPDSLRRI